MSATVRPNASKRSAQVPAWQEWLQDVGTRRTVRPLFPAVREGDANTMAFFEHLLFYQTHGGSPEPMEHIGGEIRIPPDIIKRPMGVEPMEGAGKVVGRS